MFTKCTAALSKPARVILTSVATTEKNAVLSILCPPLTTPRNHAACSTLSSQNIRYTDRSQIEPTFIHSHEACRRFLESYDNFLFDCDGVLWENDHVTHIPGIPEAIKKLNCLNKRLIYVTNNSTKSRLMLQKKFYEHGFDSNLENIFTNSYACALYLKQFLGISDKVYLVGGEGTQWELDQLGIGSFGIGPDVDAATYDVKKLLQHELTDGVNAVLVGFDEHFSFNKILKAATYLMSPQCHFIATNIVESSAIIGKDDNKRRMPLTGVMVNAIAEAADRKPVVVGKPFGEMLECVIEQFTDMDLSRTVFIGDSLKADMGFAKNAGLDSALVLTGVNSTDDIAQFPNLTPNFVLQSLSDIAR